MPIRTDLQTACRNAGLPQPPLPSEFIDDCKTWSEWTFGTQQPDPPLYESELYLTRVLQNPDDRFLFIGQDGYGVNNWYLHYYVNRGNLAILLQTPWGGAFADEEESIAEIGRCFDLIGQALSASEAHSNKRSDERLIILQSDIGGSRWGWFKKRPLDDSSLLSWEFDDEPLSAAIADLVSTSEPSEMANR